MMREGESISSLKTYVNYYLINLFLGKPTSKNANIIKKKIYVIVIRNPIERFIYAFKWRHHLLITENLQRNRFPKEYNLLQKFTTVNELAESLYDNQGNLVINLQSPDYYIHHIKEDINYYLDEFLIKVDPNNIIGVITTENLADDMHEYFNVNVTTHIFNNKKKYDTKLSKKGYDNLRKYLYKDYQCIDRLYTMKKISEKQHKLLSK